MTAESACSPTPLLLLHGLFGETGNWNACQRYYAPRRQVLVPELPLFSLPSGGQEISALSTSVLKMMDEKGIDRAVVAGNSLGGHVALRLAIAHPDRVEALVLTGSSGLFERGFERRVPRRPSRDFLRTKIQEVFHDPAHVTDELLSEVGRTLADPRKIMAILRLAKAAKRDNLANLLQQVRCPALLVWGENDGVTPPSVAEEFHAGIPDSRLHFIPECGHAPMMEHPVAFIEHLDVFLSEISARESARLLPALSAV